MISLSFKDIKFIIGKCCSVINSDDISDRYKFSVNLEKMDNIFRQKDFDLRVLGFARKKESRVPSYEDIQLISEYMRQPNDIANTFNGKTQICEFMILCKSNIDGPVDVIDEDGNVVSDKELFNFCNVNLKKDVILDVIKRLPVYKILVVRNFDYKTDKFDYKIYIRTNYEMVNYYKKYIEDHPNKNNTERSRN